MHHLFNHVKAADYDRYMLGLFQPAEKRMRWMALCAFHGEIAKLPMSVSDPTIGLIRIAWWREALEELKNNNIKKRHEIIEALAEIRELPLSHMELLLNAYEVEIEKPVAETFKDLEQRILHTTHVLHQMLYVHAEEKESLRFGLVSFLKSIYPLARLGKAPFPLDMANPDSFGSNDYLTAAKKFTREVAEQTIDISAPMRYYIKRAANVDYNLLQHDITQRGVGYYIELLLR